MQAQSPKIRAYQPADNSRLEELIAVLHDADSSLQAADYLAINAGFRSHDPTTDRFVLEDASEIIGYAWIAGDRSDRNDCWLCVAPQHRRKGYGRRLLETIITRAVDRAATGVMAYLPGQLPALEFASQAGFVVKGYARDLRLPAQTPRVPAALPSGWRLEPYSESLDVARYARVLDASYADLWGHGIATPEVMQTMLRALDPRDVFFVIDGAGADVGCAGVTRGDSQSVDAPGLLAEHRSPENYQAVLAIALNHLEPDSDVMLHSWGDHAATVTAYIALGFVETECSPMAWRGI